MAQISAALARFADQVPDLPVREEHDDSDRVNNVRRAAADLFNQNMPQQPPPLLGPHPNFPQVHEWELPEFKKDSYASLLEPPKNLRTPSRLVSITDLELVKDTDGFLAILKPPNDQENRRRRKRTVTLCDLEVPP